jgi:hypothetical protein
LAPVRGLAFVILLACRSDRDEAATPAAELHADPWSPERALSFTFTVEARQEQRLAPPFHGPGGTWLYLAATAGGGTFGVLVPEYEQTHRGAGDLHELELVPTTRADGERVVDAFVTALEVDERPLIAPSKRLRPASVRVEQDARRRDTWTRLTLFCGDAQIFFDFSIVERRAAFASKDRRHDRDWAGCLATTLWNGAQLD